MSLNRVTADKLEFVQATTFAAESLLERRDLQPVAASGHHATRK
jgi:hypothetical protein